MIFSKYNNKSVVNKRTRQILDNCLKKFNYMIKDNKFTRKIKLP